MEDFKTPLHDILGHTVHWSANGPGWKVWERKGDILEDGQWWCIAYVYTRVIAILLSKARQADVDKPIVMVTDGNTIRINPIEGEVRQ